MFDAIVLWLHVLAAATFVGPQLFLVAVMPAMRSIDDVRSRQQATHAITRAFGALGGVSLLVLLATGIWNFYDARDQDLFDIDRYFVVLQVKLTLVTLVIVLAGLHAMVFGRRLQRLQEENAPEAEIASARQWSMLASMGTLVLSIAILLCAALLSSQWSKMA
jgi:uncharacterized membrane protein